MFDLVEQVADEDAMRVIDTIPQSEFVDLLTAWQDSSAVQVADCLGLDDLARKHGQAIEADLMQVGLRVRYVGESWFSWADFVAFIRWLPRDSAFMRSKNPEFEGWGVAEYQLADMVDSLGWLVWAKTKDGSRGRNKPKPYPRPGVEEAGKKRVRGVAVPMNKVKERLQASGVQQ